MPHNLLRKEVLSTFKKLHRTSRLVFQGNDSVRRDARREINEAYKKNKDVTELESIKELITTAKEIEFEIRTTVAELEETRPGVYKLKLRPEMFDEPKDIDLRRKKQRKLPESNCCGNMK